MSTFVLSRNKAHFLLFLFVLVAHAPFAAATSADDRLNELEKKIDTLQKTYLSNNKDAASAVARAETLSQQSATLQGTLETSRHILEEQDKEMKRLFHDLDIRLQALEERLRVVSQQTSLALKKISPQIADEGELYQRGLSSLQANSYLEAISSFQAYVKRYPKGTFTSAAQYFIAESLFSLRDYRQAIKEYQLFIEKNPKHEKVKAAILKQGMSFYELSMNDEAKAFFDKVVREYPTSEEAKLASERRSRIDQQKPAAPQAAAPDITGSYPAQTLEEERKPKPNPQPSPPTGESKNPEQHDALSF